MKAKEFLIPMLFIVTAIIGLFVLVYLLPDTPQVGTAIGVQNVYASGLSDETKELVEDLRWKHNPFLAYDNSITVKWEDYYSWNIYFEDGTFYVETLDGKWFIEMQKMEKEE